MEAMENLAPEVARLFAAKQRRRESLAHLSFPQKVQAVIKLQEMAAPVLRRRGKMVEPWRLESASKA